MSETPAQTDLDLEIGILRRDGYTVAADMLEEQRGEIAYWKDKFETNNRQCATLELGMMQVMKEHGLSPSSREILEAAKRSDDEAIPDDGIARCGLCGKPMPEGEEMFQYHGFSGPCPKEQP